MIHKPKKRYEEIYESIETKQKDELDTESMKNELKLLSELNEKNKDDTSDSLNITSFSKNSETNYSMY